MTLLWPYDSVPGEEPALSHNEQAAMETRRRNSMIEEYENLDHPLYVYEAIQPLIADQPATDSRDRTVRGLETLKGPPSSEEMQRNAQPYFDLWSSVENWVTRKIASVEIVDRQSSVTRLSYDLDFSYIRAVLATDRGGSLTRDPLSGVFMLPLEHVAVNEYFGVDIESAWPKECCLASNRESLHLLTLIVGGCILSLADAANAENVPRLVELAADLKTNDETIRTLFDVLKAGRLVDLEGWKDVPASSMDAPGKQLATDIRTLAPGAWRLVTELCAVDAVIVIVPNDPAVARTSLTLVTEAIVPQFYSRSQRLWRRSLSSIGGPFVTTWVLLPGPFSAHGSWRVRLKFPPLTRVRSVRLLDSRKNEGTSHGPNWSWMKRSNEVQVHGTSPTPQETSFAVVATTTRAYFAVPAFAVSLLLFITSALVTRSMCVEDGKTILNLQECGVVATGQGSLTMTGSPLASIFLLVPSIVGIFLLARDEHAAVSSSLGFSRLLLSVSVVAPLFVIMLGSLYERGAILGLAALINTGIQIVATTFFFASVLAPTVWGANGVPSRTGPVWFVDEADRWAALTFYTFVFALLPLAFTYMELH